MRVLLTADEPLLARGLKHLLEAHGFRAHYCEHLERARRMLNGAREEVIVWAGDYLDAGSVAQALDIRQAGPDVGLCVLANGGDVSALRALLSDRAEGFAFLLRNETLEVGELLEAIDRVSCGRSALEPCVLERLATVPNPRGEGLDPLSDGEREVLELVALGLRNSAIARRLFKSEKTIEKRVSQLFVKLGLDRGSHPELDRRVAAARIFLSHRALRQTGRPPAALRSVPPAVSGRAEKSGPGLAAIAPARSAPVVPLPDPTHPGRDSHL